MKNKILGAGFLSSLAMLIYVFLIALFFDNAEKIMGRMPSIFGFAIFLLLLVMSAAISGTLMFGRPVMLFLSNFKKEAVWQLVSNLVWIFILLIILGLVKYIYGL